MGFFDIFLGVFNAFHVSTSNKAYDRFMNDISEDSEFGKRPTIDSHTDIIDKNDDLKDSLLPNGLSSTVSNQDDRQNQD